MAGQSQSSMLPRSSCCLRPRISPLVVFGNVTLSGRLPKHPLPNFAWSLAYPFYPKGGPSMHYHGGFLNWMLNGSEATPPGKLLRLLWPGPLYADRQRHCPAALAREVIKVKTNFITSPAHQAGRFCQAAAMFGAICIPGRRECLAERSSGAPPCICVESKRRWA